MSDVNLSDWKLDKIETLYTALAYVYQYTSTSPTDFKKFKEKIGVERGNLFLQRLKDHIADTDNFNPVQHEWDLADTFMALQDELERELEKEGKEG